MTVLVVNPNRKKKTNCRSRPCAGSRCKSGSDSIINTVIKLTRDELTSRRVDEETSNANLLVYLSTRQLFIITTNVVW